MEAKELDEVIDCLGNNRRLFYYFKDRYCLDMLDWQMTKNEMKSIAVSGLSQSPLKRFAAKPIIKEVFKDCGNGLLTQDLLRSYWPDEVLNFTLTLDRWGEGDRGYDQTSRNQQNLVLQVNFDNKHNQHYRRLIKPCNDYGPFEYRYHPIRMDHRNTMSWVRIDFDLSTGEALIEEIQNDWLRKADWGLKRVTKRREQRKSTKPSEIIYGVDCEYSDLKEYTEIVLKPYKKLWAEVSLIAAINFIRNELGMTSIYYHSFDTGKKIKKIYSSPPKSMYTQLPKKFGFELTEEAPRFICETKCSRRYLKAIKNPRWYHISV